MESRHSLSRSRPQPRRRGCSPLPQNLANLPQSPRLALRLSVPRCVLHARGGGRGRVMNEMMFLFCFVFFVFLFSFPVRKSNLKNKKGRKRRRLNGEREKLEQERDERRERTRRKTRLGGGKTAHHSEPGSLPLGFFCLVTGSMVNPGLPISIVPMVFGILSNSSCCFFLWAAITSGEGSILVSIGEPQAKRY